MIRFYTAKELASKFQVNLARWKRWSREFLRPDPLGGLQSGYARQYNPDEAFTVVLGGHLVRDLKFTIPEARKILQDLRAWLVDHDFYFDFSGAGKPTKKSAQLVKNYQIAISSSKINDDFGFSYSVRGMITDDSIEYHGIQARQERFIELSPDPGKSSTALTDVESYRMLNISVLRKKFLRSLEEVKITA